MVLPNHSLYHSTLVLSCEDWNDTLCLPSESPVHVQNVEPYSAHIHNAETHMMLGLVAN